MLLLISLFIVFSICSGYSISSAETSNFTFTAQKKLHSCTSLTPISIYSCYLSKFPEENINYRTNDAKLQWIGNTKATYEAEIDGSSTSKFAFLELRNIDTVGEIFWNGEKIGTVANSFRRHLFDVSSKIRPANHLQIDLSPPISSAKKLAEKHQIPQFPECPVPAQTNGQCHINMLRKAQYSFSWDWGPSLPDSGIYEEPRLISFDSSMIYDAKLNLLTKFSDVQQTVQLQLLILHPNSEEASNGEIQVSFEPSLPFDLGEITYEKAEDEKNLWKASVDLSISIMDINWWWPHGMGKQDLYTVELSWIPEEGEKSTIGKEFGFRSVELVQDQLPDGRSFYFKINEKPIFMSGSNWIPSSSSIASFDNYYEDNLQSAVEAGIKILRVWGGGIYEQDVFYSLANRLGIMIWQDFMFTCSTYENDSEFLNSVKKEVSDQIWRLSSNPSVVAWAGNNENEAALATNWWSIPEEKLDLYFGQYRDLYINTIQNTVINEGLTTPFVLSSPSNGKESELSPFGIAKNQYDPNYGDVHFYDYKSDCTDWRNFPKTRFASEFGYQSWGLISSIENVTASEDRFFSSNWATQRNHHQDGNEQILGFITQFFGDQPWIKNQSEDAFWNFVYLSQTVQSICTSSQANFYRSRAGQKGTMGALYWQLNDVWPTVSWSSLDYSKNWKPLHHQIKKSFDSDLSLIINVNENDQLEIYAVSDNEAKRGRLKVQTRSWTSFEVLGEEDLGEFELKMVESNLLVTKNVGYLLNKMNCPYGKWSECFFTITFKTDEGKLFSTWQSSVPIREIYTFNRLNASISISSCEEKIDKSLQLTLESALPQPFVWLETKFRGRWDENFLLITEKLTFVTFKPAGEESISCDDFLKNTKIFYPSKVLVEPPKPSETNRAKLIFVIFSILIAVSCIACCIACMCSGAGKEKIEQSRNLKFGKLPPRVANRRKYRQL